MICIVSSDRLGPGFQAMMPNCEDCPDADVFEVAGVGSDAETVCPPRAAGPAPRPQPVGCPVIRLVVSFAVNELASIVAFGRGPTTKGGAL